MYGVRNSELSTCLFQFSHKTRQTMLLYAYYTPTVDFQCKFNHHQSFLYEWRLTARTIRKFRIGPSIRIESRIGRTIQNRIESRSFAGPYVWSHQICRGDRLAVHSRFLAPQQIRPNSFISSAAQSSDVDWWSVNVDEWRLTQQSTRYFCARFCRHCSTMTMSLYCTLSVTSSQCSSSCCSCDSPSSYLWVIVTRWAAAFSTLFILTGRTDKHLNLPFGLNCELWRATVIKQQCWTKMMRMFFLVFHISVSVFKHFLPPDADKCVFQLCV